MNVLTLGGKSLTVRVVRKGDRYGKDDCLVHREDMPLIEFYDKSFQGFGDRGQFISHYYADTLEGMWGCASLDLGMGHVVGASSLNPVLKMVMDLIGA